MVIKMARTHSEHCQRIQREPLLLFMEQLIVLIELDVHLIN